jgi:hypothetical protein
MHMMKQVLALMLSVMFVGSCDEPATQTTAQPTTDSVRPQLPVEPTRADRDLVQSNIRVNDTEMADDSVFADGSKPTSWSNAGFDDPVAFKKFLKTFRFWVNQGLKDSVAAHASFPMRNPKVKSSADFVRSYDTYITPTVRKALQDQSMNQIFRNAHGAMIGKGELWFRPEGKSFVLYAINNQ